jgi:hypothetical protein
LRLQDYWKRRKGGSEMGFLNLMSKNSPKGINEAMRIIYNKSVGTDLSNEAHDVGLLNAMYTRRLLDDKNFDLGLVWLEISPFLLMEDRNESFSSLCEYVVARELPKEANIAKLSAAINGIFLNIEKKDEKYRKLLVTGYRAKCPWISLFNEASLRYLNSQPH